MIDIKKLREKEILERTLRMSGSVTTESVHKILELVLGKYYQDTRKEIVLHICSGGGDVSSAISFYETIKLYNVNLVTVATGTCGSAALTMFLAGKHRFAISNLTKFLAHQISFSLESKLTPIETEELLEDKKFLQENCIEIIKKTTKISNREFKKLYYNEKSSTAIEMKKLGFVHEILM